jgi:hypothetical protein
MRSSNVNTIVCYLGEQIALQPCAALDQHKCLPDAFATARLEEFVGVLATSGGSL